MLFSPFINDLKKSVNSELAKFADENKIYSRLLSPKQTAKNYKEISQNWVTGQHNDRLN